MIVRENTEGFYADRNTYAGTGEFMPTPDVAIAMGVFTRPAIERIARTAFELARRRRQQGDDRAQGQRAAAELRAVPARSAARSPRATPTSTVDDFHIDAMTVHLLRRAADFDVVVTENMFGDILSDMAGELAGSLGHRAVDQRLATTGAWRRPRTGPRPTSPAGGSPTRSR